MAVPQTLSIGEVARRGSVATSTLRYYDRIGLLPADARENGRRRYHPAALRRLDVVKACQQAGFTLHEIAELLHAGSDWTSLARRKRDDVLSQIRELRRARDLLDAALRCGCADLESCKAPADQPLPSGRRALAQGDPSTRR